MIYATSDLHGYPLERFKQLLDKAGFCDDDYLFILGDVIDRNGDGGVEMLQWLMLQPNIELLLGNHEAMLLQCSFIFDEITDQSLDSLSPRQFSALLDWMANGAEPTMTELHRLSRRDPDLMNDILDYLRDAPLYEEVSAGGRDFVLCHAGLGNFHPDKALDSYSQKELLWTRPKLGQRYFDDAVTVFGHTPTVYLANENAAAHEFKALRAVRTETWIDIDTGAAAGEPCAPMLLRLDDLKEFYAD